MRSPNAILDDLRTARDLGLMREVSRRSGVSYYHLSRLAHGKAMPGLRTLMRLDDAVKEVLHAHAARTHG